MTAETDKGWDRYAASGDRCDQIYRVQSLLARRFAYDTDYLKDAAEEIVEYLNRG